MYIEINATTSNYYLSVLGLRYGDGATQAMAFRVDVKIPFVAYLIVMIETNSYDVPGTTRGVEFPRIYDVGPHNPEPFAEQFAFASSAQHVLQV